MTNIVFETEISISAKHDNTLIIEPHEKKTEQQLKDLMNAICKSTTKMEWLNKRGFELEFCMFGCDPYIRNKSSFPDDQQTHWLTKCKGNPDVR